MKHDGPLRPPAWLARLLTAAVDGERGEELAGDLHEEFTAHAARAGRGRACAWYAAQVAGILAHDIMHRTKRHRAPALHPDRPGDSIMRSILTDARRAARTLVKRPALAALVVGTLSLGLGANAAIFQVIDALILRPFTIPDVGRIALVAETGPDMGIDTQETVSPANFLDWRKQTDVFDHLGAFEWWEVNLASGTEAQRASGFRVTSDFFAIMGVRPAIGREFTADEETPGRDRRVILSHDLWQRRFGGDRGVIGRTLLVDSQPFEVIGIMPPGFNFPLGASLWGPLAFSDETRQARGQRYLTVLGRLKDGRTLDDASAQMAVVGDRLAAQYPEVNRNRGARVLSLNQGMRDQGLGPIVALWQASAGFVLLIACANIANLLLARGAERQREIAVRAALGAGRLRIVRELLVESVILALAAVPAALAIAWLGVRVIRVNLPPNLVRFVEGWQQMDVDLRLVFFTFGLALLTAVVFGILPALRASRPHLTETLKDGSRGATAGRTRQRLRQALVVGEVALALPLLVASGLSVMSAQRFLHGAQGYDPDGLLIMRAVLPDAAYTDLERRRRFVEDVERRLDALPGVADAAIVNVTPTMGGNSVRTIEVEGEPPADPSNPTTIDNRLATPGYLATLRIPILQGRGITEADTATSQQVVVLSQSAAQRHFGDREAIGRRVRLGTGPWLTVVGVCGDVIHNWFGRRNAPTSYRPYVQAPGTSLAFVLRSVADPVSLAAEAQAAVRAVDPAQAVFDVMTMRRALADRTIGLQYVAAIMAVFGGLALVLAVVGVYSLMAFIIAQRTHEIGVRIALGATASDVLRLTVRQSALMTMAGVAVGLALSVLVSRALEATLDGVIRADVRLSAAVAMVLIAAAVAAGYVPARRATSIDPLVALRQE